MDRGMIARSTPTARIKFLGNPGQFVSSISTSSGWSNPPTQPILEDNEIHIWRAFLECETSVLHGLNASLAPDEKTRAARFVFQRNRNRFIAARGILRKLLGAYMHQPALDLNFTYGPDGKPALRVNEGEPSIHFNLSHSHGLAVYAISTHREVGIDVEAIRPGVAGEEIAGRFFSKRELAELHSLPREFRDEGFFLCWTRKEAYLKAQGSGMGIPLDSFEVSLTPGQPEVLRSADCSRWSLRSLQPAPEYVGAVVGEGSDWELRLWHFREGGQFL